jgi:hypothetical protein
MSILYRNIAFAVALKTNQLADAVSAAAFETVYTAATLATALAGVEIPLSEFKRMTLASEKRIGEAIAMSSLTNYRSSLYGLTDPILSGAQIPRTDTNGSELLGAFSNFRDQESHTLLTEKPKETIDRMNRLYADGHLRIRPFHYHRADNVLTHTREGVYAEGCFWSYDTQSAAFDADGSSPLPQACEGWFIADILANASQEGWFVQEAGVYEQIAQKAEEDVKAGMMPAPSILDTTANSEPVKN